MKYVLIVAIMASGCTRAVINGTDCKMHKFHRMSCKAYTVETTDNIVLIKE